MTIFRRKIKKIGVAYPTKNSAARKENAQIQITNTKVSKLLWCCVAG
jgi:hypothetical protein